jgi:predicted MFS family arabinose efflux permease
MLTLARLSVNITRRFTQPFIPSLSRDLLVPESYVQNAVALQAGIGVSSPLFGPLSERFGRKRVMMGALLLMAGGAGVGALVPQFGVYLVVMLIFGAGKMIFDPAMQAYIGDRVPYERRGMALGIVELAWAGALIVSPIIGWMLVVGSLRLVMVGLMVSLLLALVLVFVVMPMDRPARGSTAHRQAMRLSGAIELLRQNRAAQAALVYGLAIAIANDIFYINYGTFMERSFGLLPTEIGIATTVIAVAEVLGEFLVIGAADRFGKRRLAVISALVASVTYLALPTLGVTLPIALVGLFILFVAVETSIVAAIPIYSEVLPEARSVMLSASLGAASLGRLIGALVGTALFASTESFMILGITSLVIGLMGTGLMWRFVRVD